MTQLSANFSLEELTFSQTALRLGIDNTPPAVALEELQKLCETLLEPARLILGVPLHVDSGYRCPELNSRIGGASASAHMDGRAADIIPIGMPLSTAFEKLQVSDLPWDQLITECGAWLHMSIAPDDMEPRRQVLAATGHPGAWRYQLVA